MSFMYKDKLFATLDLDLHLERVAGGNETEVYRTDDQRYVVKVKGRNYESLADPLAEAKILQTAADEFAQAVGPKHSLANYYIISRNDQGQAQPFVVQPYLMQATALHDVDYSKLSAKQRHQVAKQLRHLIKRAVRFYILTGKMPDMYGRTSNNQAERERLNAPHRLPWRLWSFLVKRTLLRANNLMLTLEPKACITLVDYDPVRQSALYQRIYYAIRLILFIRDYILIGMMEKTGQVAAGE